MATSIHMYLTVLAVQAAPQGVVPNTLKQLLQHLYVAMVCSKVQRQEAHLQTMRQGGTELGPCTRKQAWHPKDTWEADRLDSAGRGAVNHVGE